MIQCSVFGVQCSVFRVHGSVFSVQCSGFRMCSDHHLDAYPELSGFGVRWPEEVAVSADEQ